MHQRSGIGDQPLDFSRRINPLPSAPLSAEYVGLLDLSNYLVSVVVSLAVGLAGFVIAFEVPD